ncbi:hypothetical protein C2E23DRAFT_899910 [Lenzites betulinus]|nr:hypothetical protein C2E23DRAFT_899910 [Lenzites betulinus]
MTLVCSGAGARKYTLAFYHHRGLRNNPCLYAREMLASQSPAGKRTLNFLNPDSVGVDGPGAQLDTLPNEYEMNIRLERMRVLEALSARDVAVGRLAEACASIREKANTIRDLSNEKTKSVKQLEIVGHAPGQTADDAVAITEQAAPLEIRRLVDCLQTLENKLTSLSMSENCPPNTADGPAHEYKSLKQNLEAAVKIVMRTLTRGTVGAGILQDSSNVPSPNVQSTPLMLQDPDHYEAPWTPVDGERIPILPTATTTEKIHARYAVLASLPLPPDIPVGTLTPIGIPSPYTLHDFVSTMSGPLRAQVGNYRVFQHATTTWCPEREEHGYYLTPVFKCNTNPRVSTAHRWSAVDLATKLDKPTECFFTKDGHWYYAGIYLSFRLEDLCPQEWECLSAETSQALIKETLVGRKNTSPQNVYETGQLYSAGALKIACIGIQCISFNEAMYRGLMEHAAQCTQSGKWRAMGFGGGGAGLGLGTAWNTNSTLSPPGSGTTNSGSSLPPPSTIGSVAPGSPAAPLAPTAHHLGRGSGLASVPPSARNI